jgi:hypothetical protein
MNRLNHAGIACALYCAAAWCCICTAMGSSSANADVVTADWNNNTSFAYEITHMPDFDQRRMAAGGIFGLPGNGGMYCVPTSTTNMMAYAANHGFADLGPGPNNWQNASTYNTATLNIFTMGLLMDTDAVDGTGGDGWLNGANQWLDDSDLKSQFTVQLLYHTGLLGPNLNLLAQKGIQGNLVSLAYGRYERTGTVDGTPLFKRVGGHIVTMAKAERNGQTQKLWVRDPADDPANTTQSPFMNRLWNVENVLVYVEGSPNVQRIYSALDYEAPAIGEKVRFIDGALTLKPKFGMSFTNTGGIWSIVLSQPFVLHGFSQIPSQIDLAPAGAVLDGIVTGDANEAFTLQAIPGVPPRLHRIDLITRESQALTELASADQIAFSPKPAVYVMSESKLRCVDLTTEVPGIVTIDLPLPGSAVTYDDVLNEVVVLSIEGHKVLRYSSLEIIPCVMPIPASIPLEGFAKIAVDPTTGMHWFVSQATDTLYGWKINAAGAQVIEQATLPGKLQPISVDFDDMGHMFVGHAEGVTEFVNGAPFAGWIVVPNSSFGKAPGGAAFRVTKSLTNFDPLLHAGPAWNNIDPEELSFGQIVLDCDGDVTHNGFVDVDDLLGVINDWGTCPIGPCSGDATGNRIVDVDDLLEVINGWGLCS